LFSLDRHSDVSTQVPSIGKPVGSSGAGSWDGDIAEIITYERVLSSEEISLVEAYLNFKWLLY